MEPETPETETSVQALLALLSDDAFLGADRFFKVELDELNDSGVEGEALLALDEDTGQLTVLISAEGLEADQVHIQHIHGFTDGTQAAIPDEEDQDSDGDGFLEVGEGAVTYGPVLLNLRLDHEDGTGGDNGHSHDDGFEGFPLAPDGTIQFVETYQLPADDLPDPPELELRHMVIHGLTADDSGAGTTGEVNGTAGYKVALPAAIGEIEEISARRALNRLEDVVEAAIEDRFEDLEDRLDDLFDEVEDQIRSALDLRLDGADWLAV